MTLKPFFLFIAGAMLLAAGVWLALPQPTEAQCGSSASSCKTCHETQKQHPVNTQGDWHTQHAFGDFCEFCHAGNVQATDMEAAHQGLVPPLEDVAASCQSCHPQDTTERAQKYAAVLGVELGAGGSAPASDATDSGAATGATTGAATGATTGGGTAANCAGVTAPLGGEEIDINQLYAERTSPALIKNWGNLILSLLIAGLAIALLAVMWTWEDWGLTVAGWFSRNIRPVTDAIALADGEPLPQPTQKALATAYQLDHLLSRKPALKEVWEKVSRLDNELLHHLNQLLSDTENGPDLLKSAGRLDAKLVAGIKAMEEKDRILLLNLVKEMDS